MMNEQVRRIMTKNPTTISPSQSIQELTEIMYKEKVQQLPVVEEGQFVGLITTHDLWAHPANQEDLKTKKVSEVMNEHVIKISPKDKVGTAAELFMDKRFKTLPVVNLKNELKGVVTSFDVLRHALRQEYENHILYKEVIEQNE